MLDTNPALYITLVSLGSVAGVGIMFFALAVLHLLNKDSHDGL